jgi:hypothetical protein
MGGYNKAVSGQRISKHVPAATNRRATIRVEILLETGCFFVVRVEWLHARDKVRAWSALYGCVKTGLQLGGRGIAIVGAITRKRLLTD